jgi:hypothetical protein
MLNGTPGQHKALLKELIVEVSVESRDSIVPTFRLPASRVRVTETMVVPIEHNTNRAAPIVASALDLSAEFVYGRIARAERLPGCLDQPSPSVT